MAKTKISLQYPYNKDWKSGYLVTNPEGRKTLILYNSTSDRSSTQYARYLKAVQIGRYLTNEETVDHINGDKTDDSIENLQILSMLENNRKTHCLPDIILTCPICKVVFTRTRSALRGKRDRAAQGKITCSRSCGGKYSHITKQKNLDRTLVRIQ